MPCLAPCLPVRLQIKPAVLRNFDRYEAVLLKPWYPNSEQEWTSGEGAGYCRLLLPMPVPPARAVPAAVAELLTACIQQVLTLQN